MRAKRRSSRCSPGITPNDGSPRARRAARAIGARRASARDLRGHSVPTLCRAALRSLGAHRHARGRLVFGHAVGPRKGRLAARAIAPMAFRRRAGCHCAGARRRVRPSGYRRVEIRDPGRGVGGDRRMGNGETFRKRKATRPPKKGRIVTEKCSSRMLPFLGVHFGGRAVHVPPGVASGKSIRELASAAARRFPCVRTVSIVGSVGAAPRAHERETRKPYSFPSNPRLKKQSAPRERANVPGCVGHEKATSQPWTGIQPIVC